MFNIFLDYYPDTFKKLIVKFFQRSYENFVFYDFIWKIHWQLRFLFKDKKIILIALGSYISINFYSELVISQGEVIDLEF